MLELCGRGEVSPWFGYLNEMRRELPIMHGGVFETADGALTTELSGEQAQLLSKMRCWAYYSSATVRWDEKKGAARGRSPFLS